VNNTLLTCDRCKKEISSKNIICPYCKLALPWKKIPIVFWWAILWMIVYFILSEFFYWIGNLI